MTPEAQRIAIAEASGWTRVWDCAFRQWTQRSPDKAWATCDPDPNANWELHRLPDYLNDLNAMHEAEETLSRNQRAEYWHEIIKLCNQHARLLNDFDRVGIFYQLHATAAQRAEAFLRTIGKWEESA